MRINKKKVFNSTGFTLVELLIVIAVLSSLIAGLLIVINPIAQIQKANDAKRKSDLTQIQKALEQYYNDKNAYPDSTGNSGTAQAWEIMNLPASQGGVAVDWGTSWGTYINLLPSDPSSTKRYAYKVSLNNQTYWLYASLDTTSDPQVCQPTTAKCPNAPPGASVCGASAKCNYGATSSNTSP